jgi:hypothetical protein
LFSSDQPDQVRDVETYCNDHGIPVDTKGDLYNVYLAGVFQPGSTDKKRDTVPYKMDLATRSSIQEILSHYNAIAYQYPQAFFFDHALPVDGVLEDPGFVAVQMPLQRLDDARIVLQVGHTMLGAYGTRYMKRVVYEPCGDAIACYSHDGTIILTPAFQSQDEGWKYKTAMHEILHLLTPHLSPQLYTFAENMKLEALFHRIVFRYDPIEVYDELYADMEHDVFDRNPYWMVGNMFVTRNRELGYSPATPGLADIFATYQELGGETIDDINTLQLGKFIFDYAFAHPETNMPTAVSDVLSMAYANALSEVFAEIGEEVLTGADSDYASDPLIRQSFQDFLSIATHRQIVLDELVEQLRSPDGIVPYESVPLDQP